MLRRVFLLRALLGWLVAVGARLMATENQSWSSASLFKTNTVEPLTVYVSPQGRDSNSKQQPTVDVATRNTFTTIAKAKEAIAQLKTHPENRNRPIRVVLRGGTYFLTKPLIFRSEDSGSIAQPITYQSYPQEQAIISGGIKLTGWQQETVNNLKLWTVKLPAIAESSWQFQQLWVNGSRRYRSRYPNTDWLQIKKPVSRKGQPWSEGNYSVSYRQGDLDNFTLKQLKGAELVVMNRWVASRLPIKNIDSSQQKIYFEKSSVFKLNPGDYYYLENSLDFLTTPGEWYLDRQAAKLYYLPLPKEDLTTAEVIAPVLNTLMVLRGNPQNNEYLSHLKFQNLTFAHTDWHLPPRLAGYNQNASEVPAAIRADGIQDCVWHRCDFVHLGNYALELRDDCQYNRIASCNFYDLGGGGIKIGNQYPQAAGKNSGSVTSHNFLVGNHLYEGGKFFPSAVAIAIFKSHDNLIARNQIHDYYYTGITVMGTWGIEPTSAYQNRIEYNHIHHIGQPQNSDRPLFDDLGGIYILGAQPGTKVSHNTVHDIQALRYGGWGIYLDAGSSEILVEHNLVHHTSHGGFSQHYGKENLIRYNIFALGENFQLQRHRKDLEFAKKHNFTSFYFVNNIVYWDSGKFISGVKEKAQSYAVFRDNIYWHIDLDKDQLFLGGLTWSEWQKGEPGSQAIDPLFVAPQEGNFQLQPNSPVSTQFRQIVRQ